MGLWPTQGDEKCIGPAITVHGTVALSFVIPSAAEGSAVLRTLRGNVLSRLLCLNYSRDSLQVRRKADCAPGAEQCIQCRLLAVADLHD